MDILAGIGDFLLVLCKYVLAPVLAFFFGIYREKSSQKNAHDKKIFIRVDQIINSNTVTKIVDDVYTGYLPFMAYEKSYDLDCFLNSPANWFLDDELNKRCRAFAKSLGNLSGLYALSPSECRVDSMRATRLLLDDAMGFSEQGVERIRENEALMKKLEDDYRAFRLLIKGDLYL